MTDIVKASHYSFHSGGREDIDVWMLGCGRPFAVELHNPWRCISGIKSIDPFMQSITSDLIIIKELWFVSSFYFDEIMKGEKLKSKLYTAVVWVQNSITPQELQEKINTFRDTEID